MRHHVEAESAVMLHHLQKWINRSVFRNRTGTVIKLGQKFQNWDKDVRAKCHDQWCQMQHLCPVTVEEGTVGPLH